MKIIYNFFLDKKEKGHQNCYLLKNFIEKLVENRDIEITLGDLSKILNIPINILKDKSKQIILHKFDFKKGKFNFKESKLNIFFDYLIFLFLILSQIINFKLSKNNDRKNIDVMLDNISHTDEIYRFKNIISNYDNSLIVLKKKINYDKKKFENSRIIFNKSFLSSSNTLKGKLKLFLIFGYRIFRFSLKKRFNFFKLINIILNSTIKYNYLFDTYKVKFLLHDRFFSTCPIRNFLLKEKCNGTTGCIQVHLAESVISMFNFSDIIFTFGNESDTKKKIENLGGKVSFSYGVGSLKAEHLLDNNFKNDNSKFSSEILVIGINLNDWFYTSNITSEAYYNFLNYIKKLSLKLPNSKIIYKHHGNFKWNDYEENLFKNTNVKIFIDNFEIKDRTEYVKKILSKRKLNHFLDKFRVDTKNNSLFYGSYNYLLNSKFVISFGSSMVLEAIGLKKPAYFINPQEVENPFFANLKYLNNQMITNFNDLETKVKNFQNNKNEINNNEICVSGNTSKLITQVINNVLQEKD